MTSTARVPAAHAPIFRAGLIALGAVQALNGAHALLFPRSFYEDFPLGRGWVAALPDYSEHLVRDVGGLFLATAVLLLAAGWFLERRLVAVALVGFLAFSLPHAAFHLLNLGPYEAVDAVANVVALTATVLVPVGLLLLLARGGRAPARAPAGPAGGNGRIEGVGDRTANPMVRLAFRESRKHGGGEVMDPVRIYAHHPRLLAGYGMLERATEKADRVPDRLKHLAALRAAMLCGCEWCLDYGSAISTAHEVAEEDLRELPRYAESDRFDGIERLVLDYATAMSRTPCEVPDELFADLRERLDAAQLVELTNVIALENYRARFNWAFGLAGQGYADGSVCVPAASPPASSAR